MAFKTDEEIISTMLVPSCSTVPMIQVYLIYKSSAETDLIYGKWIEFPSGYFLVWFYFSSQWETQKKMRLTGL